MDNRKILLVEDNPDDEALTLRALKNGKIANEVVVARDGAEALEYLSNCGVDQDGDTLPALVLLDVKLPKIDGLEVLRRLRAKAETRLLPVVILTTSEQERDIALGYSLGANSYIRKPIEFVKFAEAVRWMGVYWLAINEPPPRGRRA